MAAMGNYCKAYLLGEMRKFENWEEKPENARKEPGSPNGQAANQARPLTDDCVVYLQESYYVTDGIFMDEHIIFDNVTPEWIEFCRGTLAFEVPESESLE